MMEALLIHAVCGLNIEKTHQKMVEVYSSVKSVVSHQPEIGYQKNKQGNKIGRKAKLTKRLKRVALGTTAIAGTTFLGVCFFDALRRADSILKENATIKGWLKMSWKESLPVQIFAQGRKMVSSWNGAREVITNCGFDWFFLTNGAVALLGTTLSTVWKGYKFGGTQIYKGICGEIESDE